jgi:hypothetical protein
MCNLALDSYVEILRPCSSGCAQNDIASLGAAASEGERLGLHFYFCRANFPGGDHALAFQHTVEFIGFEILQRFHGA